MTLFMFIVAGLCLFSIVFGEWLRKAANASDAACDRPKLGRVPWGSAEERRRGYFVQPGDMEE